MGFSLCTSRSLGSWLRPLRSFGFSDSASWLERLSDGDSADPLSAHSTPLLAKAVKDLPVAKARVRGRQRMDPGNKLSVLGLA